MVNSAFLWFASLAGLAVAEDGSCLLQSAPANAPHLQAEDPSPVAFANGGTACPEGFVETAYNWSDASGLLSTDQIIGPEIKFKTATGGGGCDDAGAIWTIDNNDFTGNADEDLQKCPVGPDRNLPVNPGDETCNILVVQTSDTPNEKVNDCAGGGTITVEFTQPLTVLAVSWWDSEEDPGLNGNQVNGITSSSTFTEDVPNAGDAEPADVNILQDEVLEMTFVYAGSGGPNGIRYCVPVPGEVIGDPHIHTMDGHDYLLLNQGSFALWHLTGLKAGAHSSTDVDWQIYTHYSGHKSFTKGLLLVDQSGGKPRQTLELTSQDCTWRSKTPGKDWAVVDGPELISVDSATGFDMTGKHVRFYMNGKDGRRDVAVVSYSCRPSHNINMNVKMLHSDKNMVVEGELRPARKAVSLVQTTDEEYQQHKSWTALGGSGKAAVYLEAMDEPGSGSNFLQTQKCQDAQKAEATKMCQKHLGEKMAKALTGPNADFFGDCVFDVCTGAGEVAAELAAELMASSQSV